MGNEDQNRSANCSIILWAIEIEIGFRRRLQGMNGEKYHNICFAKCRASQTDTTYKKQRRLVGPRGTREKNKLTRNAKAHVYIISRRCSIDDYESVVGFVSIYS